MATSPQFKASAFVVLQNLKRAPQQPYNGQVRILNTINKLGRLPWFTNGKALRSLGFYLPPEQYFHFLASTRPDDLITFAAGYYAARPNNIASLPMDPITHEAFRSANDRQKSKIDAELRQRFPRPGFTYLFLKHIGRHVQNLDDYFTDLERAGIQLSPDAMQHYVDENGKYNKTARAVARWVLPKGLFQNLYPATDSLATKLRTLLEAKPASPRAMEVSLPAEQNGEFSTEAAPLSVAAPSGTNTPRQNPSAAARLTPGPSDSASASRSRLLHSTFAGQATTPQRLPLSSARTPSHTPVRVASATNSPVAVAATPLPSPVGVAPSPYSPLGVAPSPSYSPLGVAPSPSYSPLGVAPSPQSRIGAAGSPYLGTGSRRPPGPPLQVTILFSPGAGMGEAPRKKKETEAGPRIQEEHDETEAAGVAGGARITLGSSPQSDH